MFCRTSSAASANAAAGVLTASGAGLGAGCWANDRQGPERSAKRRKAFKRKPKSGEKDRAVVMDWGKQIRLSNHTKAKRMSFIKGCKMRQSASGFPGRLTRDE